MEYSNGISKKKKKKKLDNTPNQQTKFSTKNSIEINVEPHCS